MNFIMGTALTRRDCELIIHGENELDGIIPMDSSEGNADEPEWGFEHHASRKQSTTSSHGGLRKRR